MMSAALRAVSIALCVCSCANAGGNGPGGGDDAPRTDAAVKYDAGVTHPDTPPPLDASIDATIAADAAPDGPSGPFCSTNGQCTVAGECCVTLGGPTGFCAPGTILAGQCFPQ